MIMYESADYNNLKRALYTSIYFAIINYVIIHSYL